MSGLGHGQPVGRGEAGGRCTHGNRHPAGKSAMPGQCHERTFAFCDPVYRKGPSGPVPKHIRSDNGPEMTAIAVREWLGKLEVGTLFIEPGSPWENGYCESFNGKLRDELLNGEIFNTIASLHRKRSLLR